jgi:hypothetical protein
MSSAIKAIFVDMGDTLLTNEGKPYEVDGTDLNVKVLRELVATGIPFNMLTGLPPELLRKAVLEPYLKLATYVLRTAQQFIGGKAQRLALVSIIWTRTGTKRLGKPRRGLIR